jgi:hypothetical protein
MFDDLCAAIVLAARYRQAREAGMPVVAPRIGDRTALEYTLGLCELGTDAYRRLVGSSLADPVDRLRAAGLVRESRAARRELDAAVSDLRASLEGHVTPSGEPAWIGLEGPALDRHLRKRADEDRELAQTLETERRETLMMSLPPFTETAERVIGELVRRGVDVAWEYPGLIRVSDGTASVLAGDANAPDWGMDLYSGDDYLRSDSGPELDAAPLHVVAWILAGLGSIPRCPWTSADECATAAERSVAGIGGVIPGCAVHGRADQI